MKLRILIAPFLPFILFTLSACDNTLNHGASDDLSVNNINWSTSKYGGKNIAGTVINHGRKTYGYAQVSINLYDSSGTQIGSTLANINNLEPGKLWKFEAVVLEANATNFKVMNITGF